jgi:hypothetical protein
LVTNEFSLVRRACKAEKGIGEDIKKKIKDEDLLSGKYKAGRTS